jgi:hypothetical protein
MSQVNVIVIDTLLLQFVWDVFHCSLNLSFVIMGGYIEHL